MKNKYDLISELGWIDEKIAEWELNRYIIKHYCPICGKQMIWFVDTLLCPDCDRKQLFELKYDDMKRKEILKCKKK